MKEKEVVKKRNVAIELWRFIAAVAIIGFHIGWIIAGNCDGSNGYWMNPSNWFLGASELLLIFTVTAGYFMVSHFKRKDKDKDYKKKSATSRAWEYTWARVKTLLPVLILGYVLGIIICTKFYYPDYNLQQVCTMIVNSIWEFLGFHAVGLRSGGNEFFNLNGPLWFISAIMIVGYFLYWLLCKNEELLRGILAPFTFIFLAGWWCFTGTRTAQTVWSTLGLQTVSTNGMGVAGNITAFIGFNNGLIFVLLGMLAGIILWYIIDKIKEHKFTKGEKNALTIIYSICTILLLWYVIDQPTWFNLERWTVAFLCITIIGLSLLNKDGITALLNNKTTSKIFAYLGNIALYIYMLHYPIAIFIIELSGENTASTPYSFWRIFIPTIILTILLSILTKLVMEVTIFQKKELKASKEK